MNDYDTEKLKSAFEHVKRGWNLTNDQYYAVKKYCNGHSASDERVILARNIMTILMRNDWAQLKRIDCRALNEEEALGRGGY